MKKLFFSVAALAAAISFTACSSEDVVSAGETGAWNEDGTGYMAFNISMPKDNGSRANDNYINGTAEEYAVKDAMLLIFTGTGADATATFHSAYDLGNGGAWYDSTHPVPSDPSNVTVDNKLVAKIEGAPTNMKAFVVLNNNGFFTVDNATHSLKINGENFPVGHTFAEFQGKTTATTALDLNATAFTSHGILMMNAPLYNNKGEGANPNEGGGGKLHILAPVNAGDHIYKTEADAKAAASGAASVYVERAVAKVTVKAGTSLATGSEFSATLNGWTLDNTNNKSYLLRSVEGFDSWVSYKANNKYRMVGNANVGHTSPITMGANGSDGYRTYFAKDLNYDGDYTFGAEFNSAAAAKFTTPTAMAGSEYCAENTFDVEHMKYRNTTRAIVKAKITPNNADLNNDGAGFYSKAGDDKFYTADQMGILLQNYVNEKLSALATAGKIDGIGTVAYTVTPKSDHKSFTVKVTNVHYPDQSSVEDSKKLSTEEKNKIDDLTSAQGKEYSIHTIGYDFYEDGVCYYDTRIQHFGQDHTPWNSALDNVDDIAKAYGNPVDEQLYLGRWGVLRNNWYELTVGSVNKIGYAHPENLSFDPNEPLGDPDYPNTPDDNQKSEQWISVDVNILSWAKRTQPVEF